MESLKPIFHKIKIHERLNSLGSNYSNFEKSLEENIDELAFNYIQNKFINSKYFKSERFIKIQDSVDKYSIFIHLAFNWGLCEFLLYTKTKQGVFIKGSGSTRKIFKTINEESPGMPSFKTLDELYEIIDEYLLIFEDFTREFKKYLEEHSDDEDE